MSSRQKAYEVTGAMVVHEDGGTMAALPLDQVEVTHLCGSGDTADISRSYY